MYDYVYIIVYIYIYVYSSRKGPHHAFMSGGLLPKKRNSLARHGILCLTMHALFGLRISSICSTVLRFSLSWPVPSIKGIHNGSYTVEPNGAAVRLHP